MWWQPGCKGDSSHDLKFHHLLDVRIITHSENIDMVNYKCGNLWPKNYQNIWNWSCIRFNDDPSRYSTLVGQWKADWLTGKSVGFTILRPCISRICFCEDQSSRPELQSHMEPYAASKEVELQNHSFWHSIDYVIHFLLFHFTFCITLLYFTQVWKFQVQPINHFQKSDE